MSCVLSIYIYIYYHIVNNFGAIYVNIILENSVYGINTHGYDTSWFMAQVRL